MRRIALPLFATALVTACGVPAPRIANIIQDGCVTAAGSHFVLTALHRGESQASLQEGTSGGRARPTTDAYVLVGADAQLRKLVGRRVRIAGEAEPVEITDFREVSPLIREPGDGGPVATSGSTSAIGTGAHLRLQIQRVRVLSANATGDPCMPAPRGA
jgi:hypothetical protein